MGKNGKMKRFITVCLLLLSSLALADSFVIQDIRVEGLQRISVGTVFNFLAIKVGDEMTDKDAKSVIRALFKSKYFNDVSVERQGNILIIKVKERPAIASIEFVGNKDVDSDQLLTSLRQIGFSEGRVYEKAMIDRVKLELQRQYFSRGKYGVNIESEVSPLTRNRVAIRIIMSEGAAAKIGRINIVGNTQFNEDELLADFESSTGGLFSFITNDNQYSRQKLSADLERLRSFYLDRGYVDFAIESTQVAITDDKKQVFITINISEGDIYRIKEVRIAGDLIVPEEQLFGLVTIGKDSIFSRKDITKSTELLTARFGDDGYAFANVNAIPEIDRNNRQVVLTFFVDPGRRVYVRRINISGNSKTRDEVLRREMRQQEAAWMSTEKVERSRARIKRLGYFEDVSVETLAVPGAPDQIDLDFNAIEITPGTLSLSAGIGYSQSDGIIFNTSVSQKNFLGSGKRIDFSFSNSKANTIYSFGYQNPFFTIDGISQGFNAFYRETDAKEKNIANYTTDVWGGDVSFGVPVSEENRVHLGLGYEHTSLTLSSKNKVKRYRDFVKREGNSFDTVSLTLGWSSDSRDSAFLPTSGMFQNITTEVATPIGDIKFYKLRYKNNWFRPLTDRLTLALSGHLGYADAYGSTKTLPFFENFYAGGIRSVRGFKANTLGIKDASGALGGNFLVTGSTEIIFPIPFLKKAPKSVRLSAFVDTGNVYDSKQSFDASLLRYSAGLSTIWISPLGPMSFSLVQTFNEQKGDSTESFQFALGSAF